MRARACSLLLTWRLNPWAFMQNMASWSHAQRESNTEQLNADPIQTSAAGPGEKDLATYCELRTLARACALRTCAYAFIGSYIFSFTLAFCSLRHPISQCQGPSSRFTSHHLLAYLCIHSQIAYFKTIAYVHVRSTSSLTGRVTYPLYSLIQNHDIHILASLILRTGLYSYDLSFRTRRLGLREKHYWTAYVATFQTAATKSKEKVFVVQSSARVYPYSLPRLFCVQHPTIHSHISSIIHTPLHWLLYSYIQTYIISFRIITCACVRCWLLLTGRVIGPGPFLCMHSSRRRGPDEMDEHTSQFCTLKVSGARVGICCWTIGQTLKVLEHR